MEIEAVNIVQLLCDLSEASGEVFPGPEIGFGCHSDLRRLTELGAIEPGPRPETVTCNACDADHPAMIEYDVERRCYVYFCPETGFVTVNDADLITHKFRPEWLVGWLTKALHITSSAVGRRALVPGCVWQLGDATCGATQATVIFARRVASQAGLDQLASAVRSVHPADKGLVITTSLQVARQVQLPGGYELLRFPEIVRTSAEGLVLDRQRFDSWIRGMRPTTAKGAPTRMGRPSSLALIRRIYHSRREQGLNLDNDSAEARAILAEWPNYAPDEEPPGSSTVRGHVARLKDSEASAR